MREYLNLEKYSYLSSYNKLRLASINANSSSYSTHLSIHKYQQPNVTENSIS